MDSNTSSVKMLLLSCIDRHVPRMITTRGGSPRSAFSSRRRVQSAEA
jgi:hypothetical protein